MEHPELENGIIHSMDDTQLVHENDAFKMHQEKTDDGRYYAVIERMKRSMRYQQAYQRLRIGLAKRTLK